jgi:hypothetical protein
MEPRVAFGRSVGRVKSVEMEYAGSWLVEIRMLKCSFRYLSALFRSPHLSFPSLSLPHCSLITPRLPFPDKERRAEGRI